MNKKLLIMDVDGTLTDGKLHIGDNGEIFKSFHVRDGYGISNVLPIYGYESAIITGRKSMIVEQRAAELRVGHVFQGVKDKVEILEKEIIPIYKNYYNICYIGDDLNDMDCMLMIKQNGGIVGCPADAVFEIKKISDFISAKNGGEGAVREFIEYIINKI